MRLSSFFITLGAAGTLAAPVEQQPLPGSVRHHAGPHKVADPYTPDNRNPYDKKVDAQGDKLHPLPWVSVKEADPLQHQTPTSRGPTLTPRSAMAMARTCWAPATGIVRGRTQI
jgi:hypothetical protein